MAETTQVVWWQATSRRRRENRNPITNPSKSGQHEIPAIPDELRRLLDQGTRGSRSTSSLERDIDGRRSCVRDKPGAIVHQFPVVVYAVPRQITIWI